ncbi:hypothetical protein FB451DRAFT_1561269 [Mycena latifolia]|nr:hypothetical protein FB451DRAFT_1561269 [Mycena latifolia]
MSFLSSLFSLGNAVIGTAFSAARTSTPAQRRVNAELAEQQTSLGRRSLRGTRTTGFSMLSVDVMLEVCGRITNELPYSFSLQIRLCSVSCSGYHLRLVPRLIDKRKALATTAPTLLSKRPAALNGHWKAMYDALPYLEWTKDEYWYLPSAIQTATEAYVTCDRWTQWTLLETWRRKAMAMPAFMELSEALLTGAIHYRRRKPEVERRNRIYLKALARNNGLTWSQLVASPTLARHANAFTRDLAVLTDSMWLTIRDVVLAEVRALNGLQEHIRVRHPADHVELELAVDSAKHRCSLCPGNPSEFALKNLKKHMEHVHLAVRKDL